MIRHTLLIYVFAVVLLPVAVTVTGCGGGSDETQSSGTTAVGAVAEGSPKSRYLETLNEFRDAVAAEAVYDAYGYALDFPAAERATIEAFCAVADQVGKGVEGGFDELTSLEGAVAREAEADLTSEGGKVSTLPIRRAVAKLGTALGLESLDRDLARGYVRACYG